WRRRSAGSASLPACVASHSRDSSARTRARPWTPLPVKSAKKSPARNAMTSTQNAPVRNAPDVPRPVSFARNGSAKKRATAAMTVRQPTALRFLGGGSACSRSHSARISWCSADTVILPSVRDLVLLQLPFPEGGQRFLAQELFHRQPPPGDGTRDLVVDEIVAEPDPRSVAARAGVVHALHPGPVDGRQAHGARLAARVQLAPLQAEGLQPPARAADGHDLGMRRGIVGRCHPVPAAADHLAVSYHHRAERAARV